MKTFVPKISLFLVLLSNTIFAQSVFFNRVRVINMIPQQLSSETTQDREPSIGVNPVNTRIICASAFTPNPDGDTETAPIFITDNGGATWTLNNILPSGSGSTGDISVKFNSIGDRLYAGILKGGSGTFLNVLETENPLNNTLMNELFNRTEVDQPFIQARTLSGTTIEDKLFIGSNMGSNNTSSTIHTTQNARETTPTFSNISIDSRSGRKDRPSIRPTIHSDGTVYAVFVAALASSPSNESNIVVVRDDNWGRNNYLDLIDPSDSKAGFKVASNVNVPRVGESLGAERISSRLSIIVHPNNSNILYLAFGTTISNIFTLHVVSSTDRGLTWSNDLLTIQNATNPALAITTSGTIGFSYQQLKTLTTTNRWETHFRGSKGV